MRPGELDEIPEEDVLYSWSNGDEQSVVAYVNGEIEVHLDIEDYSHPFKPKEARELAAALLKAADAAEKKS